MNMIISSNDFMFKGQLFIRDDWSGRYYRLDDPSGFYTRAARKGLLVKKRISQAWYKENLEKCKAQIAAEDAKGRTS
jgi:hypothetical protein